MAQVARSPKTYDVCVIGSGAGGGMAAKILTEGGLSVALLEAGPQVYPEKDFKMLMWPYELPHRGAGVGGAAHENFGEFLAPNGAWDIAGEPYISAPGADFQWFRSRIVGGRTNHWGRIALRFAPVDFRSYTRDSLGADWPISYEDLAPYYDKVDQLRGSCAVLRQSGIVYRRVWHEGECVQRAGRRFPAAAEAALPRTDRQEGLRQAGYHLHPVAPRDPYAIRARTAGMPLLRAMRTRMHHRFQFQFQPGFAAAGDGYRQADADYRGYGTRGSHRQGRKSRGRLLHRQSHAH